MLAHSLLKFDRFESVLIKSCAIEPALIDDPAACGIDLSVQ